MVGDSIAVVVVEDICMCVHVGIQRGKPNEYSKYYLILSTPWYVHVLMRDEKEERKKRARSNKQLRQSNTAHPRQLLFLR